jgi:hypothetical protein
MPTWTDTVETLCATVEQEMARFDREQDRLALARAQEAIDALRERYRSAPAAVAPHLERIKRLAAGVRQRLSAQAEALARDYTMVALEEQQLAERRHALRSALLEVCRLKGEPVVRLGAITAVRQTTLRLPPATSPGRARVEQLLRDAGRYAELTVLSAPRLQSAVSSRSLPDGLLQEVQRLCDTQPTYRLQVQRAQAPGALDAPPPPDPDWDEGAGG